MPTRILFIAALLGVALGPAVHADGSADALRQQLTEQHPDFAIDEINPAPVSGIYEVVSGANVLYISADGRHVFRGELLDLESDRNLTAERKSSLSHRLVDDLGEDNMVVYQPDDGNARHTVTVFTDTTCGYCRQLHEQMLELIDDHRIKLRYVMYPRAGVDSSAADTLRDVWCSADPRQSMTRAKRDEAVPRRSPDCDPPVAEQYETGRRIGVSGTPYMLLNEDGPVFAGYRPPDQLLSMLEASRAE